MSVLEWIVAVLATVAVVAGYLWLEWLANRWWRGLPESFRRQGLLGLAVQRFRRWLGARR